MGFPRKFRFPGWMFSISLSQREDQPADPRPQLIKERGPPCCYLFCSQFITDTIWPTNFGLGDFFLLTNVFSFSFSQRNYLDTMLSCYLFLVISLMISFRDVRVSASGKCPVICCAQRFFFSPYFWGVECCCFKVIQQFDASCFYYETQRLNYFIMSHVIK